MKIRIIKVLLIFALLTFSGAGIIEARRGCCSWHGGVCGCQCCDGTPLSDICAPYYPECSDSGSSAIICSCYNINSGAYVDGECIDGEIEAYDYDTGEYLEGFCGPGESEVVYSVGSYSNYSCDCEYE